MTEVSGNRTIENEMEDVKDPVAEEKESIEGGLNTSTISVKESTAEESPEDEVVVHATAIFDGSPTCTMMQSDTDFLEGIIFGQNHLKGNISKL
jgi:hypothetical protein